MAKLNQSNYIYYRLAEQNTYIEGLQPLRIPNIVKLVVGSVIVIIIVVVVLVARGRRVVRNQVVSGQVGPIGALRKKKNSACRMFFTEKNRNFQCAAEFSIAISCTLIITFDSKFLQLAKVCQLNFMYSI